MVKVSIITPTWNRRELLQHAIKSVQRQTFIDWEHIIISDGIDGLLAKSIRNLYRNYPNKYKFVELGRNWRSTGRGDAPGVIPRNVGCYLSRGQYIAYLDDDNTWRPNHLQLLVGEIEKGYDWVYSRMEQFKDGVSVGFIGDGEPKLGQIDTNIIMHKWELFKEVIWKETHYWADWDMVHDWIELGKAWSWVNEITCNYTVWR